MRRAFTLIELLIVVTIIGILAAIAIPNFMNARIRARIAESQGGLDTYKTIQHMYFLDEGEIPGTYFGKNEHCPYINLGYIGAPLLDSFGVTTDLMYPYLQGMLHSHDRIPTGGDWTFDEHLIVNSRLTKQWLGAGKPNILFGQGPVGTLNWDLEQWFVTYAGSNGVHSNGCFVILGVKGKGPPGTNLENRRCNSVVSRNTRRIFTQ